jgi:hypothetical protein
LVPFAARIDAMHEQWAEMNDDKRAFLVYCLQRLYRHLDEPVPQRMGACASGRDTTGTTDTVQDAGTS